MIEFSESSDRRKPKQMCVCACVFMCSETVFEKQGKLMKN